MLEIISHAVTGNCIILTHINSMKSAAITTMTSAPRPAPRPAARPTSIGGSVAMSVARSVVRSILGPVESEKILVHYYWHLCISIDSL